MLGNQLVGNRMTAEVNNQTKISNRIDVFTNKNWLKNNSSQYSKQWVALCDGQLVDYDKSKKDLYFRLISADKDALLVFIP